MYNEKMEIEKFFRLIIFFIALLLIPINLFGGETDIRPENISEGQDGYILVVKGNFISLKAKDASLRDIIEEIGRRMKIEVVVNIPREEKITIEFDSMYLGDAIKRFKTNYAYITASEKESGKISKIVAVPESKEKLPSNKVEYQTQQDSQPSDVGSEYDPQPSIQKFEQGPHSSTVKSDPDSRRSIQKFEQDPHRSRVKSNPHSQPFTFTPEQDSQTSDVGSEYDSQPSSTAPENETQPPAVESGYDPQPPIIDNNN